MDTAPVRAIAWYFLWNPTTTTSLHSHPKTTSHFYLKQRNNSNPIKMAPHHTQHTPHSILARALRLTTRRWYHGRHRCRYHPYHLLSQLDNRDKLVFFCGVPYKLNFFRVPCSTYVHKYTFTQRAFLARQWNRFTSATANERLVSPSIPHCVGLLRGVHAQRTASRVKRRREVR